MANFDGFTPHPIERFTSLFEQDDVTNAPLGVAAVNRNSRHEMTAVQTRYGVNQQVGNAFFGLNMGTGFPVTGMNCFKYEGNGVAPDKTVPLLFDQNGTLLMESPAGSGTLVPVTSTQVSPGAGLYMQADQTLNRAYMAFTNVANPSAASSVNAVLDLNTGILDPLSMRPVGQTWAPGTKYQVGEVVTPILISAGGNGQGVGRSYRASAITTGISANVEPVWPGDGGNVVDGGVTWTENTLIFSNVIPSFDLLRVGFGAVKVIAAASGSSPNSGAILDSDVTHGAGGYAAGRDVYCAATLVNNQGETNVILPAVPSITNTLLNDQLNTKLAGTIRAWLAGLGGVAPTGWNLYVADVATGAAAPVAAAYHKIAGGPFSLALNTQVNVNATGAGAAPPTANTATITLAGNVDAGPRWAGVLYLNRNGYISGYGPAAVVQNNIDIANFQLFFLNVAKGPPNTAARIIFITVAGGTSAGPFAYIPSADSLNGIPISATVINDNTTTTGTFNFVDTFLDELLSTTANVTNFFDKLQVPALRSVYYSKTLDRMIYLPYIAPSGAYISPKRDPETVLGSTGLFQCAETDGQNLMAIIDYNGIIIGLKEESGHEISPDASNPSNWDSVKRWDGKGPCGLRAWAMGTYFFVFVHRSGVYAYFGDKPERITKEIPKTWKRVNWAAAATIWAAIDEDTHEIKIGVPLDRATVPSHTLSCNFEESRNLDPPVHSTIYSRGKFISSAAARKWSIDDIPANQGARIKRTVLNPPAQFDAATIQSQFWYASSFDSGVNAMTPDIYTDNGNLIPWVNETACPGDALKLGRLGGAQALMTGQGSVGITVLAASVKSTQEGGVNNRQTEIRLKDAILSPGMTTDYKSGAKGVNERFRLRFSTVGKAPGTWGRVMSATIYTNPLFQARPN